MYLKVFLTNLGKYNEGDLVGKWVDIDGSTDWNKELEEIGIDGVQYEEYFISDYDSDIPGIFECFGEYPDFNALDELGEHIHSSDFDEKLFKAIMEAGMYSTPIDVIESMDDHMLYEDVHTEDELGRYCVDNFGMPDEPEIYFDYEFYGRDCRMDLDPDNPEDKYLYDMDDQELGEYFAEDLSMLSKDELEIYFDYEKYGRDIAFDGTFTAEGFVTD